MAGVLVAISTVVKCVVCTAFRHMESASRLTIVLLGPPSRMPKQLDYTPHRLVPQVPELGWRAEQNQSQLLATHEREVTEPMGPRCGFSIPCRGWTGVQEA